MAVVVRVLVPLLERLGVGDSVLSAKGSTIVEIIDDLERQHPGVRAWLLCDGNLRRFVNIYIGDQDIRFVAGLSSSVADGAEIWIVSAIAGG